jgi:hypothetical protein
VKSLTEKDREWIKAMAKVIYDYRKIQNLGDASFRDLRKHIAISLAMFAHFFLHFIQACTEDDDEMINKLAGIIDFVVEQITRNQVGRVGENIDLVEEVMGFISKVDEAGNRRVELQGLSFKQVCQKTSYTPSHRVGELLKKFFFKRYRTPNGTRLVFTPSCLISLPSKIMFPKEPDVFSSTAPQVIHDKERLLSFTEEEARIWLEVFRLRHGDRDIPVLVRTFELDKLPQFQKVLGSFTEQLHLIKPEKYEYSEELKELSGEEEDPEEDLGF